MYKLQGIKTTGEEFEETFEIKGECFKRGFSICFSGFQSLKALHQDEVIHEFDVTGDVMNEIDFRMKEKEIKIEQRFLKEYG